jgi:hypothetical protein
MMAWQATGKEKTTSPLRTRAKAIERIEQQLNQRLFLQTKLALHKTNL